MRFFRKYANSRAWRGRLVVLFFAITAFGFVYVSRTQVVQAHPPSYPVGNHVVWNNFNPYGWIPTDAYNYLVHSNLYSTTPAYTRWISPASNYAATSIDVIDGRTSSVQLAMNFAGVVGRPSTVIETNSKIVRVNTRGTQGLEGTVQNINFGSDYRTAGTYRHTPEGFSFLPESGKFTEDQYTITVFTKGVSRFENGTYRCVAEPRQLVSSLSSYDICNESGWNFVIYVNRIPPGDYNNSIVLQKKPQQGSPDGDTVVRGLTYSLFPKVTNAGPFTTFNQQQMVVQNQNSDKVSNVAIEPLTPAGNRDTIFGVQQQYNNGNKECSTSRTIENDCWLWPFQRLDKNRSVQAEFKFKVKRTASVGDQVCFRPFVRRQSLNTAVNIGARECFTVEDIPNCPAGTDYAGQPLASQPDRNGDGVVDAADCNNPPPPTNYPYLLIKGSNVISGANFTDNGPCTTNTEATGADIYTNGFHGDDVADGLNGSSNAQYGVWSSGDIGQNGSSNNTFRANYGYRRNAVGTTDDIRDVLFANTNWSIPNTENGNFYDGDSTNPSLPCVDISADLLGAGIPVPAIPIPGGGNAQSFLNTPSPGKLYINGDEDIRNVNIKPGVNKTLIVKGTLTIGNDVTYPSSYSATDIPNVKIIASNIYIEDGTQRIDANLIAFPTLNGTTFENGIIDTCSNMTWQLSGGGTSVVPGGWPNDGRMTTDSCKQSPSLVINGSIAARRILWKRTNGTLGTQAAAADSSCYFANYSDASDDPKIVDKATMVRRYEKCAAETINTSPELYISELNNNPTQTLQVVPISTQELPPIF